MAYGTIKIDTITFTDGGIDKSVSVSGLIQNPTVTGNLTVTGTISGAVIKAGTSVSGATVQGVAGDFTTVTGGVATITSGVFALGTTLLPSISFSSDPNTGIYSPGADQVAIVTNGAEKIKIDSAGLITTAGSFKDPAITGTILEDVYTITDGVGFEVDPGNGSVQLITLGANRTPKATNFGAGEAVTLMINDGSAYTLTWTDTTWGTGGVIWTGGSAPTLATTGYTVVQFWKVGSQVYGANVGGVA